MSFTEPLIFQADKLFVFIGAGFLFGLIYEFALFVRSLFSDKKSAWIIQDVLFFITITILFFFIGLAYSNGVFRVIYVASAVIGFTVFKVSLGRIVKSVFRKTERIIKVFIRVISLPVIKLNGLLLSCFGLLSIPFKKLYKFSNKICTEKIKIKVKKHLKKEQKSV